MEQICSICKKLHSRKAKTCSKECQKKLTFSTLYERSTCSNCSKEFSLPKKKINEVGYDLCGTCRKYKKHCKNCQKIHFRQGITCSKECAYVIKKQSWLKSCGAIHNFSKESSSRKKWESNLSENENIKNVFQRESVKAKSLETIKLRYGSRINPESGKIFCNISHTFLWKEKHHENYIKNYGYDAWCDKEFNNSSQKRIYMINVWEITISQLHSRGKEILGMSFLDLKKHNTGKKFRDKLSIDHKISISHGFKENISPIVIGNIFNLEYMNTCENSSKGKKSSIDLEELKAKINEDQKNN